MSVAAYKPYLTAVRPYKFVADRQTEPGPGRFRCKERVEDPGRNCRTYARSRVVELYAEFSPPRRSTSIGREIRTEGSTRIGHRLNRILNYIIEHLCHSALIQ